MLQKQFNFFTMFISGFFFCVVGIFFLFEQLTVWNWLYITLVAGIAGVIIIKTCNMSINHKKISNWLSQFLDIILWTIVLIVSFSIPQYFYAILPRFVGLWILLHAIVKIIVFYIRKKDHLPIEMSKVIYLMGDLIISSFLLISPYQHQFIISLFMGGYFIIYGSNTLLDLVRERVPKGLGERLDKTIRLSLPPVFSIIIPPKLMSTLLDRDKEEQIKEEFEAIKQNIPVDMEVLIHLASRGPAMLGHADLVYRGIVISYGCYDPHTRKLFGTLGDGVVIFAPRDAYIKNCLENENKTLISFGISLNKKQKEKLNQRLLEIFENFKDFQSDEQQKQQGIPNCGACDDYLSRVARTSPGALFYKIKEGKFKTFFVCSTNCVSFLSNILSSIGLNVFDLSGIVSPGAYYDFLNKQFKSNKGFIVSRKLFRKKDADLFS